MNGYAFTWETEVRFSDLDAMRHVNNATFVTYLESARLEWWQRVTQRRGLDALDMILARTEIDYRSPLVFGEAVRVGVRCAAMRRSSFSLQFRVEERASGRLLAEARKVCVYYDFGSQRSLPIPPAIRAQLRAQDPGAREEA
ncbi:MAG TPA: thioesterase family protein [Vicinamibacteria bacterium]|nr:thioesterase family protein [Vicinamibacteria bacterium]